jgi:pyrimidine-specific ribonucleoside hydrolase
MTRIILDCDPGHDDAFAIMLAAKHLDVLGISTVGGNQLLERVTINALKVLEVTGMTHIPVYPGHARPLVGDLVTAPQFHGESGMDGPVLPYPTIKPQSKHAVDFIVDTVMSTDDVTLVGIGPLTNIAAAINHEPRIVERVREITIMGGSVTFGNWTPAAEFNILVDPEAAYRVFNSGIHIKMCGLNLTRQAFATAREVKHIQEIGNRVSKFCVDLLTFFIESSRKSAGPNGSNLHDPCAVAWLIDPTLIKAANMHVTVELKGEFPVG